MGLVRTTFILIPPGCDSSTTKTSYPKTQKRKYKGLILSHSSPERGTGDSIEGSRENLVCAFWKLYCPYFNHLNVGLPHKLLQAVFFMFIFILEELPFWEQNPEGWLRLYPKRNYHLGYTCWAILSVMHPKSKSLCCTPQAARGKKKILCLPPGNNAGSGIILRLQFQQVRFFSPPFSFFNLPPHTQTHTPPSASRHLCLIFKWSKDYVRAIPDLLFHCSRPLLPSPPSHCHDLKVDLRQGRRKSKRSLFQQAVT